MYGVGRPCTDVLAAGAIGDNVNDDTAVIQKAIDDLYSAYGGGVVYIPAGAFCYVPGGITLRGAVSLIGASRASSILQAWHVDATVLTADATWGRAEIANLTVYGKGTNFDPGAFGATKNAVVVNGCVDGVIHDITIAGGHYSLYITGNDGSFRDVVAVGGYGPSNVYSIGANWFMRCKFDAMYSGLVPINGAPYPSWSALTLFSSGTVVRNNGVLIICATGGMSGTVSPANCNSMVTFYDNASSALSWQMYAPSDLVALMFGPGAGENNLWQIDMSGPYGTSLIVDSPSASIEMRGAIASGGITLNDLTWFSIDGSHFGAPLNINNPRGSVSVMGNYIGGGAINVAANVSNFGIIGNDLNGGEIIVANGSGGNFDIIGNRHTTVINGGTGPNQRII